MIHFIKRTVLLAFIFTLIIFTINYFAQKVQDNFNLEFFNLIYYLGVAQALQVLVSLAIAGYVANHMLNYFKDL